ncbi:polyphenol oxidase family protein [Desulfovibrio sp. OttesenSCG-928-F07]|nr:polyphenol oxidase family protein [Desulfovibrio sp. OttesenSCG-928-F07]
MQESLNTLQSSFAQIIPFSFPNIPNVKCFFTTGLYGNISLDFDLAGDNDKARRATLPALLGFNDWTELHQVHGTTLLVNPVPTPFNAPSVFDADGACTNRALHALLSKAADCQQILLAHKSGKYVCALHCGWRGNALDFPVVGVKAFCTTYALNPCDIMAVRGPSLGPGAAEFVNFKQEWPAKFSPWFNTETRCMNLWALTRYQLEQAGIKPENIFGIDLCTYTFSNCLFSFRRGHSGRQGALVFIES